MTAANRDSKLIEKPEFAVSNKQRQMLELRTIRVSTKAALKKVFSDEERERVKTRSMELLARLEGDLIRDGADPESIAAVDAARRELWG